MEAILQKERALVRRLCIGLGGMKRLKLYRVEWMDQHLGVILANVEGMVPTTLLARQDRTDANICSTADKIVVVNRIKPQNNYLTLSLDRLVGDLISHIGRFRWPTQIAGFNFSRLQDFFNGFRDPLGGLRLTQMI
jgi:hypothetical protein